MRGARAPVRRADILGNKEAVLEILEKEKPSSAQLNQQDADGRTPLQWAVTSDARLDIVKALLGAGEVNLDLRDQSGWTALMIASSAGADKVVEELLARYAFASLSIADRSGVRTRMRRTCARSLRCTTRAARTTPTLCAACSRRAPM